MLSYEICEIFKNTVFYRTPPVAAFVLCHTLYRSAGYSRMKKIMYRSFICCCFTTVKLNFVNGIFFFRKKIDLTILESLVVVLNGFFFRKRKKIQSAKNLLFSKKSFCQRDVSDKKEVRYAPHLAKRLNV